MSPDKSACAKKRNNRKWRVGFDDYRGERVHEEGDNRKKSVFNEIVLGDWLHIEMMDEKDDYYWMRLGTGKDERVFFSYVKNGKRVIRQDVGPGHE